MDTTPTSSAFNHVHARGQADSERHHLLMSETDTKRAQGLWSAAKALGA
ncbi:hypothetical protein [Frankia sp. CIT1]|nr:hypothetical protein [Frankia sp. CIT1]